MKPEGPLRVLIEMLLAEDEITHTSPKDGGYIAVRAENEFDLEIDYYMDADTKGRWHDTDAGRPAAPEMQSKLDTLVAADPNTSTLLKRMKMDAAGMSLDPTHLPNPDVEGTEEWWPTYANKIFDWHESARLQNLPQPLRGIFKGKWAVLDMDRDFVVILPLHNEVRGRSQYKGVYIFRTNAHQSFPRYGITEGENFISYVPKLSVSDDELEKEGLLLVRKTAVSLDLGRMLRRDYHIGNITQNLEEFDNYAKLRGHVDEIPESIKRSDMLSD